MTSTAVAAGASTAIRARRYLPFRVIAVLLALVFLVLFGVWQSILTPWLVLTDAVDHGWPRTPELHRHADSAAAAVMAAVGVGALVCAVRPAGRSALVAWVGATCAVIGVGSVASVLLQQHQGVAGAALQGAATVALTTGPLVLLHPERRRVLRGGAPGETRPSGALRRALIVLVVAGAALAVGAFLWRLTGGIAESPLEDDVVSYVILGLSVALGSLLCLTGRTGWRPLAVILGAVALYGVVGGISLAVA